MFKGIVFVGLLLIGTVAYAAGWSLNQVNIKHVQSGNGEFFYLSTTGDTKGPSECAATWGAHWGTIDLSTMTEQKRYMLTLAIAAQSSGTKVDIGGTKLDCSATNRGELPIITYIRVGNHRN